MQLSHRNESIARYIVEHTNFCPVNDEDEREEGKTELVPDFRS